MTLAHTPGSYTALLLDIYTVLWLDIYTVSYKYLQKPLFISESDGFKSPVPTLTVCKSVLEANITNQRGETTFWSYF